MKRVDLCADKYELRSDDGRNFYLWRNGHFAHGKPLTKEFAEAMQKRENCLICGEPGGHGGLQCPKLEVTD